MNEDTQDYSKSLLYDDEIAEYYILDFLKTLHPHMKIVFVLDELDKIDDDILLSKVINEFKPLMLSGYANFIVVAGQNLFYSYQDSQNQDDAAIASLFSKLHHVSLLTSSQLSLLFNKLISQDLSILPPEDIQLVDSFVSYLIFRSKRVPRRFISLIRQSLVWENGVAYLEIAESKDSLQIYVDLLSEVEKVETTAISSKGYPPAIRDFLSMQLLIKVDDLTRGSVTI